MKIRNGVALAAMVAAGALVSLAASAHGGGGRGGEHGKEMLAKVDTDGNGSLSKAEIDAFNLARAQEMDLNKDGSVTADEARTFHEQQRAKRQAERFAKMDTNKDGKVSVQEIADGRGDWLMRKDANGDGQVSPDEMHSGRHGWRHGKHGE